MIKMYSLIKQYHVNLGARDYSVITLTSRRMENDINGNPRYKTHVWNTSSIWSPTIKGYKRCKDDGYVLKGHDSLPDLMLEFVKALEVSVNEL
jgi:hypothetical protein